MTTSGNTQAFTFSAADFSSLSAVIPSHIGFIQAGYRTLALRSGLLHMVTSSRIVRKNAIELLTEEYEVLLSAMDLKSQRGSIVITNGSIVAYLCNTGTDGRSDLYVSGRTHSDALVAMRGLALRLEPTPIDGTTQVTLRFWHGLKDGGATCFERDVDTRSIAETNQALAASTREAIERLVPNGWNQGGVHIWHGAPGCGKTTTVRALAHAWSAHLSPEIVLDAERMLTQTDYLMRILNKPPARRLDQDSTTDASCRRMIILEDAGELVGIDARAQAGAGLSRLLNLTDGIFGLDEAPIVIITTNEPVSKMHPAMMRAGRCRSVIEFTPMRANEASQWFLANTGESREFKTAMSIADLAAAANGTVPICNREASLPLGFAR